MTEFRFFSPVLGKHVSSMVLLPDQGKPPFATFYLLHGLSDDHSAWLRRSRIEEYVKNLPLAVVMPDGFRGAYTDHNNGPAFARYMIEDVVGQSERHFRLKRDRASRCIGGLSMGGYGALRLGLGYPKIFSSVNSHSGALMWGSLPIAKTQAGGRLGEFELVFGNDPTGSDHDLIALAQRAKKAGTLPKILIDCGTEDFLLQQNRSYVTALKKLKMPHTYREFPGAHDWSYWDQHVRDAIVFHAGQLEIEA